MTWNLFKIGNASLCTFTLGYQYQSTMLMLWYSHCGIWLLVLMLYMDNKQARMTWNILVLFCFCWAVDACLRFWTSTTIWMQQWWIYQITFYTKQKKCSFCCDGFPILSNFFRHSFSCRIYTAALKAENHQKIYALENGSDFWLS